MQNPKDDPREGPTSPRAKLSARDALLNDAYMQGNGEEQNVPFYFWDSTQGKAAAVNFGAVELLARKINQPGKIQSSGLLLAVDIKTGFITACSKNCQQFLRLSEEDVLGQQLVTIFKCEAAEVSDIFERVGPRAFSSRMCLRQINSEVEVTFSRAEGWALLEVETIRPEEDEEHALATAAIAETEKELQQAFTTEHLHHVIARGVQNVTGYDRVKIYKFHVDQHGEVLAEALRGTELESCLGLHYPATDIPQRARELFLMNPFRCIADVNAPQVDLVCLADSDVDVHRITMSSADLRAVHPCHIDYLRNMKVTASLSFAIVVKRKLWGLVACHHGNGPRMVARSIRTDCWYLVQTYTSRLAKLLQEQAETRCADVNQLKVALQHRLSHNPSKAPANDLIASTLDLFRNVLDCQGFAYVSSDMISKCGKTPSEGCIRGIETALNTSAQPGMLDSRSLSSLLDGSLREDGGKKLNDVVGVLAVRCVRGCILMWFRQEYVREVRWGGRDEPLPDGVWGARQSFEWWAESVRGECNPWTEADEEDAMHIAIEFDRMWFQDPAVERMATTPRGNVLEWNKPMERLVCMSASKAVGQNISNLCYQCDKEDVENMLASVRANHGDRWTAHLNIYTQQGSGGASFQVWKRHNAESKQVLVFETLGFESNTPLPTGPPGTGDASPGSSTPKIPHATAPLQSEVLFRVPQDVLILDEVTDVSWIMDCSPQSGAYLWANKRACETFKCTLNQFLCLDLKPDFLDSRVRELWYSKVQQQREAMHCRQSFYADTAVRLDLTITPIQVETTHGPKVLCLVSGKLPLHDGMEGSRSMEMLQASKVMMMLFSSHGELLSANVSAKVYYSMALSEQHVRLEDVFESCEWESQSERVAAFNAMMQVCNGSGAHIYEMERVKKHKKAGVVHHIQFSAARDPETGALAIAVNETDISRLKSVQNELVAAQKQQERFLAATSHELRTPLHAILALSDNMQKNPQLPEGSLKMLKIIHSSGQQLASLVNDILDAAAIQAGALVLKNDLVQLHEVAGGVIDLLSPMSPSSVKLVNSVPTSLPMLQLDSARLTQILTNLLGNACKFTRAGEIRVKAEMQGSEQDQVAITVSDTGRGIAEEHLSSIWKAFQQVDPDVKGTGLGLTIVRNLVEAMGGMISVASSVEAGSAGTSFTVVLPRRPQDHVRRLLSEKPAADADQQASKARREPAAESAGSDSSRRNSVASQSQHASCPTTPAGTWNPGMLSSSPKPRPSFSGESVESDGEARRSGGGDLRASGGSGGGGRGSPHVGDRGGGGGSGGGGGGGGGGGARGSVQESDMDLRAELESALAKLHAREQELEALKTHRAAEQHALLLAASSRLESRQSGTPPRELAPSTSFTADTDADSACPASSPTASASTFRRTSSALAPAPALRLRPCLLLSEAGAVKEEARRVLERLGVAPSVVCSLSEANLLAARPEPWPELELVLVDASALGPAGARPSSVFGPGAGCGSLARLVKAQSVPVLWLTADPDADLDAALAAGCTGVAGLPLDADALQEVLFQQRDLQRLWLWRALLHSSALFPAPPAIARRAAALAQRADGVCQHALLAAVSLTLEFPAADRSRRSAHHALVSAATTASDASSAVHKLGQLLQQCAVAVHDVAEQRGALVTHAAGDAFTLVLLPPPSPSPRSSSPSHARASPTRRSPDAALDTATLAVAALELASALLRAFDTLPDMPDGKAPVARAGLAFGPGFEAVACGLPATSGKPGQTPSARRAQEAPTLAFFGAPLLGAAAMAGSADAGAVRMGGDVFRTLFPRAEASANEFSFSPASESWFALGPNAFVPAAALAPGALPNVAVHRLPAERGDAEKVGEEGGGERGFQEFAADMLRRGRARTLLRQMEDEPTGAARVARSDMALVAVAAAKVGRCAHTLFGGVPQGARRAESGGRGGGGGGGGGGVATQSENPSDKNPPDGDRLLAKAHILSVDDSAVNQLVMESILRPLVRKLSSCMDGPDTLDVLEEGCDLPDIILLDVMMPSMSGLEVCRILRERYSPTQLPIVLVSGKSSKESIVEGLAAGANDYVTKPFDSAELLSRVKGQLMAAAMAKAEVQDAGTETIHRKMLPPAILRSWEARPAGEEVAEELEHASVLCAAIEGYSMLTSHASTREVVQALSALCLGFDELCEAGDAWRVQSAPDSYMVVAGQSQTDDDDHAARLATIGLDMIKVARSISHPVCPGSLKIRVAVHSGPVRNGVVAGSLPRYFVCGDTVDLTSRIVELTQPMTVTVSASSQRRLGQFQCLSLGRRRIGETCELETFVVKDKSSAWEAALECARRRSSIRSTTTTSSLLQDVPKYLASPLSASTTPATPVPKAPAHRPGKLQVVAVDDGFLDSGAASDVSHDDSSTLGASDLSASVERSVASPASQRRAGAPRTAPAARESRKRPQQPPAALEQQQQQQHQQHQQLAIEQQQQQQQQQQQPASMASSHNNNPHAWPASLRTAWPAVEARGCDVVAVTASSGYRWRTDPLLFVLERAKVPHLGPVLAKEGVEVDFLAHAEELELKALGLENISERARVQRFAKAWMLLHADTA